MQNTTLVIGAGQAGLSASYCLQQQGIEHVVLEASSSIGHSWRQRWDSFCLVTPNSGCRLPGFAYEGADPHAFMPRDEIVRYLERYAARYQMPVQFNSPVRRLGFNPRGDGYIVQTDTGELVAKNVVVASGAFQQPKLPSIAGELDSRIFQIHSHGYHNPDQLPYGAVLVVGSAQSGVQIAEDLQRARRQVYLAVSKAGRAPRQYRGRDIFDWILLQHDLGPNIGIPPKTVAELPSPQAKFAPNPHLSGRDGGHEVNLRQLGASGVTLLGRLEGVAGHRIRLAPDLIANLNGADESALKMQQEVDTFIERAGLSVPPASPSAKVSFEPEVRTELDLESAGITSVVWATGFRLNFGWVDVPVFDTDGYPEQRRGVTDFPGLYFVGLPWLHQRISSLLAGVGIDAAHIANHIAAQSPLATLRADDRTAATVAAAGPI